MRKPIEVWQFIISVVILIMSAGTLVVNLSNKVTDQGARIIMLESNNSKNERHFEKVDERFDRIDSKLTDILVKLQDKKDRGNN